MRTGHHTTPDRLLFVGLILTAAVYCRDLRYDFVLDDQPLILVNETFTSWHNWKQLFATHISSSTALGMLFPDAPAVHYRPFYMLWLMATSRLFGMATPWLHLTSLLLHLLVIFLVYKLARKMLAEEWSAVFAALLFALHPIHVESVAYISAVADVLVALFLLISLLCYFRFREQEGSTLFWLLSIFSSALAILSKETGTMIPWVLVAHECLRQDRKNSPLRGRLLYTLPYFALVLAYAAVRSILFGPNINPGGVQAHLPLLIHVPLVLLVYLRNLLWPFRLSFFYPAEWTARWTVPRAAWFFLTAAAVIWLCRRWRDRSSLATLLVWTAVFFVPALSTVLVFVQDDWVHDRHMYLLTIPFSMLLAAMLSRSALPRSVSIAAGSLISGLLLGLTFWNVGRFKDELTLYQNALQVAPHSLTLHKFYSRALLDYGRQDEALQEFRQTILLAPDSAAGHEEYAAALSRVGKDDEAAIEFARVLEYAAAPTPFRAFALYRLAAIELKQGYVAAAAAHLREAAQIDPRQLNYHGALSEALRRQGLIQEAESQAQQEADLREEFLRRHSAQTPAASHQ